MPRYLCVDYGHKRIGLAVGATEDGIATPLEVLNGADEPAAIRKIAAVAEEYQAAGVVVGLPLNMDDTEGPQALKTRDFGARLQTKLSCEILFHDERLSSFQADQALAGLMTRKKRKARQDAIAAANILQSFLETYNAG